MKGSGVERLRLPCADDTLFSQEERCSVERLWPPSSAR